MKSPNNTFKRLHGGLFAAMVGLLSISAAHAQIYVTNGGGISEYSPSSGAPVNTSLVGGLNYSYGLAINNDDLYVANVNDGTIGEYNAITGAPIGSGTFVSTGTAGTDSLAIYNGNLYVDNIYQNTISEYNLSTGSEVGNGPLITAGLSTPSQIAISTSGDIFVANSGANNVREYSAITGAAVNTNNNQGILFQDDSPYGIAISGNNLYESDFYGGLDEYSLSTNSLTNETVVYPLRYPVTLAVSGNNLYVGGDTGGVVEYNATTLTQVGTTTLISSSANYGIAVGSFISPPVTQTTTSTKTVTTTGLGANYSNVTPVKAVGGLATTAALIAGSNTTQTAQSVSISSTTLGGSFSSLASDVFTVTGNDKSIFTLQLTFDLNAANTLGGPSNMTLLYYTSVTGWENAVLGDHGVNDATGAELDFKGSFASFQQTYGTNLSLYLGAYGVDTSNGDDTVWAVIDHNSTFGAGSDTFLPQDIQNTPEPSTWAMLLGGLSLLAFWRKRQATL